MNPGETYQDSLELVYYSSISRKKAAMQYLKNEIISDLPELFYPYSILLLDRCVFYTNSYGDYELGENIYTFSGLSSTAIALGDVENLTEDEKEKMNTSIIGEMVLARFSAIPDELFKSFYLYSAEYYGISQYDVPNPVETVGFLDSSYDFNTEENDKLAFAEKIFELSEDEFREIYAEYPVVIAKMEEMVKILRECGLNIY